MYYYSEHVPDIGNLPENFVLRRNFFERRSKQNAPVSIGVYFVERTQMLSIYNLLVLCY